MVARTKRRQTRKGSGWFSKKARHLGIYDAPSTSLLARQIYFMLDEYGIKESELTFFDELMHYNKDVNKVTLMRDLLHKGITSLQYANILTNLKRTLPRSYFPGNDFHSYVYAAAEIYPLLGETAIHEHDIGKLYTILGKYPGVKMSNVYKELERLGATKTHTAQIRALL